MKRVKFILFLSFCFFIEMLSVGAASSKFEPTINMEQEITDNKIVLIIGYKGEDIYKLNHMISYEEKMLKLESIAPLEGFTLDFLEKEEGKFKTISLAADSIISLMDTNYAVVTFSLNGSFKVGKSADVFFYTYDAEGPSYKSRHKGYHLELKRDTSTEMLYLKNEITKNTKTEYMFYENFFLIIILLVIILVLLFIILFVLPKRKQAKIKKEEEKEQYVVQKTETVEPFKLDIDAIENIGEESEMPIPKENKIEISTINPFEKSTIENTFKEESTLKVDSAREEIEYFGDMEVPKEKNSDIELPQMKQEEMPKKKEEEDLILFQPMFENEDEK